MRIIITNAVSLNVGDSAILDGLIAILRRTYGEGLQLRVYDSHPEVASKYRTRLNFRPLLFNSLKRPNRLVRVLRRLRVPSQLTWRLNLARYWLGARLLRREFAKARWILSADEYEDMCAYRDADLVISTGGTYLVENYSLLPRVLDYRTTYFFNKPLVFFTQSLGPFKQEASRRMLKPLFRKASLLLLRDERSREHIEDLGLTTQHAHVLADGAFALADLSRWAGERTESRHTRIAISVRDWQYFKQVPSEEGMQQYLAAIAKLVEHLVTRHKAKVVFISTCQGIPEYRYDDSQVAEQVRQSLSEAVAASVRVDSDFRAPAEFIEYIAEFDLVVATRMHAAILSLCAGVPVLPIEYEFKTRELFRRLGQEHIVHDIERINGSDVINTCDEMLFNLDALRLTLQSSLEEEIERAWLASDLLRATLQGYDLTQSSIPAKAAAL